MDYEINRLAQEIGLSVDRLRQLMPLDEFDVTGWMGHGYTQEQAEKRAFITDLENVTVYVNYHAISAKSAISMLKRHPRDPWNYTSSEDDEEENSANQQATRGWKRMRRDSSDSEEDKKKPNGGASGNPGVSGYQNVNA
jgi:hypothetical protein